MEPSYRYRAVIIRWVDGDTVDMRIDCGFYMWWEGRFRLYGVDTPERGQPGYAEATNFNAALAPPGDTVIVDTYKAPDKYGRWLAEIHVGEGTINDALIQSGLAQPYYP